MRPLGQAEPAKFELVNRQIQGSRYCKAMLHPA